jgi:hypothetical protein
VLQPPGISFPCVNCTQQTQDLIRSKFLDHFNAVQKQRNATDDKLTNKFGRCPFPDCRYESVSMIWDSSMDSGNRKMCHHHFLDDNGDDRCTCPPGISFPCVNRTQQTQDVVRKTFLDHFYALLTERDDKQKRTNQLGRCPFPDCRYESFIVSKLSDCFGGAAKSLVKHMEVLHDMDRALS